MYKNFEGGNTYCILKIACEFFLYLKLENTYCKVCLKRSTLCTLRLLKKRFL